MSPEHYVCLRGSSLKSQWLEGAVRIDSALSLVSGGAKLGRVEQCTEQRMMVPLSTEA